jgi:hypothetical protein
MMMLDLTKPFGLYMEGAERFHGQGPNLFNMKTGEFVRRIGDKAEDTEGPAPIDSDQKTGATMFCKLCDFSAAYSNERGQRIALGKLRAHMKRDHGIEVPEL